MQRYAISAAVALYRLSGGAIGGRVGQERVLLLTTTGRKSGKSHTVPVSFFTSGGVPFVIASNAGLESHPAWYLNLSAQPQVQIQIGREHWAAIARTAGSEERERLLASVIAESPQRAERQPRTRQIPLVILVRA